jgi:hypothetical protein
MVGRGILKKGKVITFPELFIARACVNLFIFHFQINLSSID